jgi:hypothetical protein
MPRFQASACLLLLASALWAQQPASPSSRPPASKPSAHPKLSPPEAGAITNGVYSNPSFGFTYKLPYGWVDRTREMQDDSPPASNTPTSTTATSNPAKSLLLLAIFERPPEATGDTVNSAVVIAAEPLSSYSGLKTAADYFGPLTELATAKGFQVVEEPHDVSIGTIRLVRADFNKSRGATTVRQTSLVILERSYEVAFTFIGESEDDINQLIEKLSFGARKH